MYSVLPWRPDLEMFGIPYMELKVIHANTSLRKKKSSHRNSIYGIESVFGGVPMNPCARLVGIPYMELKVPNSLLDRSRQMRKVNSIYGIERLRGGSPS